MYKVKKVKNKLFDILMFLSWVCFPFVCLNLFPQQLDSAYTQRQPFLNTEGRWTLVSEFSDEFNGQSLDLSKWDNQVEDWGVWSWDHKNVSVADGYLHVKMEYQKCNDNGKCLFYTSGIIKSKHSPILYGYFEARIKAAAIFPGVCPAFWAYRNDELQWTEIDFVELTQRSENVRIINTNTHVFRHPGLKSGDKLSESRQWQAPWDPRDDFNVYGCEWNREEIKWYVNGKPIHTRKNDFWHQALDVVISLGVRSPLTIEPSSNNFPTSFQVDYVRIWKR